MFRIRYSQFLSEQSTAARNTIVLYGTRAYWLQGIETLRFYDTKELLYVDVWQ
jgi:hypothetical protein